MKVGDLVMLSAYARKLKMWSDGKRYNDIALVVSQKWGWCYNVVWCSDGKKTIHLDRRDLKYVKKV